MSNSAIVFTAKVKHRASVQHGRTQVSGGRVLKFFVMFSAFTVHVGFDLMYLLTTPTTDSECVPASRLWCSASRRIPETPCADPEVVANPTLHSGIRYGT